MLASSDSTLSDSFFQNLISLYSALLDLNNNPLTKHCTDVILYLLKYDPKLWTVFANSEGFDENIHQTNSRIVAGQFFFLKELHSLFQSNSHVEQSMINATSLIAKDFALNFCYQKLSPSDPSKRSLRMGFKRTNLAETVAGQLLASNERRKPPHWTNVAFASLYNDSVSKLMSKVGIQCAAKSTRQSSTLSSIGQMINHFNSKEADVVTYVPDGQPSFVENHYGVDGVSVVLKREDDSTTHQIVFKWNHCLNYKYLDRNRHEFEQDIMTARNILNFTTSCTRHVEFTQMRSSICACFPIIFDFAKRHPYWPLPLTIPVPGLVEGLVYHESCLSLCSRQLINEAIPPRTQSDPFTSNSTSLELHLPTTIDTHNLYCPIHMLPAPRYLDSTNSKGKRITSKCKLTTLPNSNRHPHNRRASAYTFGAQINRPYHLKKQTKIDREHIHHQNMVDGNLDRSGIKTLDKLTNINPNQTGLTNRATSNFCPLSDIKAW
eukprot:jgi/Psemu1/23410/gm1.23410_g